jgi:hypothetical protein
VKFRKPAAVGVMVASPPVLWPLKVVIAPLFVLILALPAVLESKKLNAPELLRVA